MLTPARVSRCVGHPCLHTLVSRQHHTVLLSVAQQGFPLDAAVVAAGDVDAEEGGTFDVDHCVIDIAAFLNCHWKYCWYVLNAAFEWGFWWLWTEWG